MPKQPLRLVAFDEYHGHWICLTRYGKADSRPSRPRNKVMTRHVSSADANALGRAAFPKGFRDLADRALRVREEARKARRAHRAA